MNRVVNLLVEAVLVLALFSASLSQANTQSLNSEVNEILNLVRAYESALVQNLDYQAVKYQKQSADEQRNVGRSYLLPTVMLNYTHAHNWSEIEQESGTTKVKEDREYESYNASLKIQQTLFDYGAWKGFKKTDQLALEAAKKLYGESILLAVKVLEAYTNALLARDQLELAKHQVVYHQTLLRRNLAMKAAGEETQTAVLETQSKLYVAESELLSVEDELDFALRELNKLTGLFITYESLPALTDDNIQLPMVFNELNQWQQAALASNHQLQALQHKIQSLDYEIEEQRAGHLPRINLFASSTLFDSNTENTYQQTYDTDTVGIQLQMPLYLGGRVSSGMGQVRAEKTSMEYQLRSQQQTTKMQVRRYFRQCLRSAVELKARRHAVSSSAQLLVATEMSIKGGVRSNQDALEAQQQLHQAKLDFAKARYEYLKAWLGLHVESARLDHSHMATLNALFRPKPAKT